MFEAYNFDSPLAAIPGYQARSFSNKLDQAMDTTQRLYRRNIRDFTKVLPSYAQAALAEVRDVRSASAHATQIRSDFDKVWKYHHTESGHQVASTTCSSDGKGGQSCTTTYHYVCDTYHHYWDYNPSSGVQAARTLEAAAKSVPALQRLQIATANHTEAWNEAVIRDAFRKKFNRNPTPQEMLERATYFKTGSQFERNIDSIRSTWNQLTNSDRSTWNNYKRTARSADEVTGCHSTNGPKEYEFVEEVMGRSRDVHEREQAITVPITKSITAVPELEVSIKRFILAKHTNWTAHYPEMRAAERQRGPRTLSAVIGQARTIYADNIPGGNENTEYNLGIVLGFGLVSGLIGAGLGWGIDQALENRKYLNSTSRRY